MKNAQAICAALVLWMAAASTSWGQTATRPAATQPAATQPATTQPAQAGQEKFEAGRTLFFQGQYKQAVATLREAVQAAPAKTAYQLLLAKAYRYAGQQKESTDLLEAILKANPDHVEAGVELAEILSAQKNSDRVIAILNPLLKFKHDYPLYHLLAEAYYQKEQWDKARENYEEAVKLNPQSGADCYQLANIYLAQQRFARAADAYEKAGRLGIDSAAYHFKLASVYFNLRNYMGAITTAQVLGGSPGQIRNEMLLVEPVPGQKDTFFAASPRSAIFQAVRARGMGIDTPQLKFLEANIYLSARRYAKADVVYKDLEGKLEKADQALFWFYWAQTALGLQDYGNYLARLDKAILLEPEAYKATLCDAYVTVASRYQESGDTGKYIEYLSKAVQASPLSARLHLLLGEACWQTLRRGEAVQQYKLVLELEPDHADRIRLLNRIREFQPTPATAPAKGS